MSFISSYLELGVTYNSHESFGLKIKISIDNETTIKLSYLLKISRFL